MEIIALISFVVTFLLWLKYLNVLSVSYTETNYKKVAFYMILTFISLGISVKLSMA